MANTTSAKKATRKIARRTVINKSRRTEMRGAVRNVEAARALKFQLFAGNLSVSHAFAHVYDFGAPVQVGHTPVRPGDLLHGDRHGVQTVPIEIAREIPNVAKRMLDEEREIIELCKSSAFTLERLRSEVAALGAKRKKTNA